MLGNKINFTSLGCPRNLVDSEVMLGILMKSGYEITPYLGEADYLIVNTCGFLKASRDESKSVIEELLESKKKGAKVIVTGCMAQTHQAQIREAYPEIGSILGSGDIESILKAIQQESPADFVTSARSYLIQGEVPRVLTTPKHYAYLKIAEGCRKRCSFCIIPKIKGPLRSKSVEQITKEFKILLAQGVQEVILIAQDLGDFGKDLGHEEGYLKELLREILKIEGDYWVRLLYIYPDEIDEELVDLIAQNPKILPYLDMPIQHINSRILQKMRRKTSKEDIVAVMNLLKEKLPDVVIRTSLMVGFPSETDQEFEELCAFVRENPLDNVGVFQFSQEEGSAAYSMEDQIPSNVKEKRYNRLMKILKKQSKQQNQRWVGKTLEVFVEGYHPESQFLMRGRFFGQSPEIDGMVIINDHQKVDAFGKKYLVEITEALEYDLVGRVLNPVKTSSLALL